MYSVASGAVVAVVLDVGLVEGHDDVFWHCGEELVEFLLGDDGTRGVVRVAHEDDLGLVRDCLRHGGQVHAVLSVERNRHRSSAHYLRKDRVGLEGTPWEDHLIARQARNLHQLLADSRGAGAHSNLLQGHAEVLSKGAAQLDGAHVWVTVGVGSCGFHGLEGLGEWRLSGFVGGEL